MTALTPSTPASRWPTDQLALAMCASDPHGCRGTTAAGRPCPWHRNLAENPAAFVTAREAAAERRGAEKALTLAADFLARVTEIGERPRREISDEDWEFYCANPLQTRAEIADWLRAAAAVADE